MIHQQNQTGRKDYYSEYIKYKIKYIALRDNMKNSMIGGRSILPISNQQIIIHISGPSGSGKTTLGNKLIDKFGDKIIVKDVDDLREEFIEHAYGRSGIIQGKKIDKENYQKFIDNFVKKHSQRKPIVFVGLNHMPWWHKKLYYNLHSDYNFYIVLNSDIIFKQKCGRFFNPLCSADRDSVMDDFMKNKSDALRNILSGLESECDYKLSNEYLNMWNRDYKQQGYKFMSREKIFAEVSKIIRKALLV